MRDEIAADRAVEQATSQLHDQYHGTEDAPEDDRSDLQRFLEDTPGLTDDAHEYLILGGRDYEKRIGEFWTLVNAIAEEAPYMNFRSRSVYDLHARLGALVMDSVLAAAEEV